MKAFSKSKTVFLCAFLLAPTFVFANQPAPPSGAPPAANAFRDLLYGVNREVINPVIVVLFLAAIIVFIYGLLRFVSKMSSEEERARGKSVMIWGLIGMFIMLAAFWIIRFSLALIGVTPAPGALPF